jgi:hypothetical protein
MRIYIKTAEGRVLRFPLPMSLVKFGLSLGDVGVRIVRKHVDEETLRLMESVNLRMLSAVISDLKKYKGLQIIDIKSNTGEEVRITV